MRGIHTCCPEPVSTININQTHLSIDSGEATFVEENFLGTAVTARVLTLGGTPYSRMSTYVFLGSGSQRSIHDFSVVGDTIVFTFDPDPTDIIQVRYLARSDGSTLLDGFPVGSMIGRSGTVAPTGWLLMNGVTTVASGDYPDLHAFLGSNLSLVDATAAGHPDPYTLRQIFTSYFDPATGTMVSGPTIIKHD